MYNLFGDLNIQDFFDNYWGRKEFLFNSSIALPSSESILREVLLHDINYPNIRVIKRNELFNPILYTNSDNNTLSNKINSEKLSKLNLENATLKIKDINKYHSQIGKIYEYMSVFFQNMDISINAYFSYKNSLGGSPHYDFYHIFAFQLEGEKEWKLGDVVKDNPDYKFFKNNEKLDYDFKSSLTLKKGNVLYIPPGMWHDVSTRDLSTHLAIGINPKRIYQYLIDKILNSAENNTYLRSDLPINVSNLVKYDKPSYDEFKCLISNLFNN